MMRLFRLLSIYSTLILLLLFVYPLPSDSWLASSPFPFNLRRRRIPSPSRTHHSLTQINSCSWETALAVVPPDEAWDRIQKARHAARDSSYNLWPPAIRLFHPFCAPQDLHDQAFELASIVQDYNIESFPIRLSEWSIIPHNEAMSQYLEGQQSLPSQQNLEPNLTEEAVKDLQANAVIEEEAKVGRQKRLYREYQRQKKLGLRNQTYEMFLDALKTDETPDDSVSESPYEEFNGPCVVCLEPDEDSRVLLQSLRLLLKTELENSGAYAGLYSPTGSVAVAFGPGSTTTGDRNKPNLRSRRSNLKRQRQGEDPALFRPIVPIAAFSTVTKAIEVAKRLRQEWEPLMFNVTDLHLVSSLEASDAVADGTADASSPTTEDEMEQQDGLLQEYYERRQSLMSGEDPSPTPSSFQAPTPVSEEQRHLSVVGSDKVFGCEALVALVGEEIEMDDELNREIAQMVLEHGEPGGQESIDDDHEPTSAYPLDVNDLVEPDQDGLREDLQDFLMTDEEEFDEGTVVVIGRVQFFTGEMRQYVGMPASSTLDLRDRVVGDNFVTGAARRRAIVHRSAQMFSDGDWGQKSVDYNPWGKGDARRKRKSGLAD